MDKPSLKKSIIHDLSLAKLVPDLENNDLILVTGYGIIQGSLINMDNLEDKEPKHSLTELVGRSAISYREEYLSDPEKPLPGNDGFITLENVKLSNNGNIVNLDHLTVFFDQIIGVTLGNLNL